MNTIIYTQITGTPLGTLTVASDGEAITGLWMNGQKHFCSNLPDGAERNDHHPLFDKIRSLLTDYFNGLTLSSSPSLPSPIPLRPDGTDFQKQVWQELLTIPYAETRTYGEIAAQLSAKTGRRCSARAIGGAVGRNPISILIPCHRVVAASSPGGYAGGIDRKMLLLNLENASTNRKK